MRAAPISACCIIIIAFFIWLYLVVSALCTLVSISCISGFTFECTCGSCWCCTKFCTSVLYWVSCCTYCAVWCSTHARVGSYRIIHSMIVGYCGTVVCCWFSFATAITSIIVACVGIIAFFSGLNSSVSTLCWYCYSCTAWSSNETIVCVF